MMNSGHKEGRNVTEEETVVSLKAKIRVLEERNASFSNSNDGSIMSCVTNLSSEIKKLTSTVTSLSGEVTIVKGEVIKANQELITMKTKYEQQLTDMKTDLDGLGTLISKSTENSESSYVEDWLNNLPSSN